eukprot:Sdes_comp20176_c0_seq1m13394
MSNPLPVPQDREAFVTLVTNDEYVYGAIVLGTSLRCSGTQRYLAVMITNQVSVVRQKELEKVFDHLYLVSKLDSGDSENLLILQRPELGVTFTKLYAWTLPYKKCVFLDADTMVLQNVDELFNRHEFSAAPDIGWPDCFNSGVFVFEPSLKTFQKILNMAQTCGSFDGGDQGLLNQVFSDWSTSSDASRRLPFIYNMNPNVSYSYLPAFRYFGKHAKIVHFIGKSKPWNMVKNSQGHFISKYGIEYEKMQQQQQRSDSIVSAHLFSSSSGGTQNRKSNSKLEQHEAWEFDDFEVENDPNAPSRGMMFHFVDDLDDQTWKGSFSSFLQQSEHTVWIPPVNAGRHRRKSSGSSVRSSSPRGLPSVVDPSEGILSNGQLLRSSYQNQLSEAAFAGGELSQNVEPSFFDIWYNFYQSYVEKHSANPAEFPLHPFEGSLSLENTSEVQNALHQHFSAPSSSSATLAPSSGFQTIAAKLNALTMQNPVEIGVDNRFDQIQWVLGDIYDRLEVLRNFAKKSPGL